MYQVIVGNIGTVYDGPSLEEAKSKFSIYVDLSLCINGGRCFGESVTLMEDNEIINEHDGHLQTEDF